MLGALHKARAHHSHQRPARRRPMRRVHAAHRHGGNVLELEHLGRNHVRTVQGERYGHLAPDSVRWRLAHHHLRRKCNSGSREPIELASKLHNGQVRAKHSHPGSATCRARARDNAQDLALSKHTHLHPRHGVVKPVVGNLDGEVARARQIHRALSQSARPPHRNLLHSATHHARELAVVAKPGAGDGQHNVGTRRNRRRSHGHHARGRLVHERGSLSREVAAAN
mmetsp:Transcript_11871/g.27311  ORF Transcript_11871/g.27311 Transcript_11871/m.27311 type:complete len:225 (+) Transcript_11871:2315-2989(+)